MADQIAGQYLEFLLGLKAGIKDGDSRSVSKALSFLGHITDLESQADYCTAGLVDKFPPVNAFKDGERIRAVDHWGAVAAEYCGLISSLKKLNFMDAIGHSGELVNELVRCAQHEGSWICIPLMTVTSELRKLVFIYIQSDEYKATKQKKRRQQDNNGSSFDLFLDEKLANVLQKPFKVCLSDKSDEKKFAVYFFANELFRTYLKFGKYDAANNLCKVLQHSPNLPSLTTTSKSQSVTYRYFTALVDCMNFDHLPQAADLMNQALIDCRTGDAAEKNRQNIIMLLLPLNFLVHRRIPTQALWKQYPLLSSAFRGIFQAIKRGDLESFDNEIDRIQRLLLKRRVYSLFIRIRPLVELRLFSKVEHFYEGGKKHIIPLKQFSVALEYSSGRSYSQEEVEFRLASLIYEGQVKGYISHGNGVIVLSKKQPFPSQIN
ncbi:DEKNAAC100529 [Brettanomyces naardenensis]|uniref:DEKNAAC100529 n=1 Tax=Brettanomyces naardenensis TaxID=13370 RepID=A0A448YFF0_BRENA|nr:DEKNAAC100529 [Brettanomyces naardenensis]